MPKKQKRLDEIEVILIVFDQPSSVGRISCPISKCYRLYDVAWVLGLLFVMTFAG